MVAPETIRPVDGRPIGGSSATCMEPSRLVCPTLATAFAGTTTSGRTETLMSACQRLNVIESTVPTTTSSIMTGEFGSRVDALAISMRKICAPGPRPTVPGSGSELRPWNAQPVEVITAQPMMATNRLVNRAPVMTAVSHQDSCTGPGGGACGLGVAGSSSWGRLAGAAASEGAPV